jgi:hypothetical protein
VKEALAARSRRLYPEERPMAEVYKVTNPCVLTPPSPATPTKIDMPVSAMNNPLTPVHKIVARQGSLNSWERETQPAQRYADIYFNSNQFATLVANVNSSSKSIYVTYNAPAIPGDDRIILGGISFQYP